MGTIQALITTGDLRLLRDDALRSAVTAYAESMMNLVDEHGILLDMWTRGMEQASEVIDVSDVLAVMRPASQIDSLARANPLYQLPPGERIRPFPPDWNAVRSNRQLFRGASHMNLAKQNMQWVRATMLAETRALKEQIEKFEQARSR
jgi:hypothetical protein